jgi:hypothetical protein
MIPIRAGRSRWSRSSSSIGIPAGLPNLFGEESALQLARDRAAVLDGDRTAIEQLLKDKGVTPTGAFLDQGRLTLRFAASRTS